MVRALARQNLGRQDLAVLHHQLLEPVHVRQLVALCIHCPVVGIAGIGCVALRVLLLEHPGTQHRQVDVLLCLSCIAVVLKCLIPGIKVFFLGLGVRVLVVGGVPLGQVLLRCPGYLGRQNVDDDRIGHGKDKLEVEVVLDLQLQGFAAGGQLLVHNRGQLLVEENVLVPERNMLGGERRAVGPLLAGPQTHGQLGAIVVDREAFDGHRNDGAKVVGSSRHGGAAGVGNLEQVGRGIGHDARHFAAVLADFPQDRENPGIGRQPLVHRRQQAGLHHFAQFRSFAVLAHRHRRFVRRGCLRRCRVGRSIGFSGTAGRGKARGHGGSADHEEFTSGNTSSHWKAPDWLYRNKTATAHGLRQEIRCSFRACGPLGPGK